jgi:hypothetical protein
MLCFRVFLWGIVLVVTLVPFCFFVGIIGRIAGFRPGSPPGAVEKVFGWFGIVFLGGLMLGICMVGWLIDWGVTTVVENSQNRPFNQPRPFKQPPNFNQPPPVAQKPTPKPIPKEWDEENMQPTFLADLQEFNVRVGWGTFGKKGSLGYRTAYGDRVKVNDKAYPNALSMVPLSFNMSTVSYRLDRTAKLFKASVAYSDPDHPNHNPHSAATFKVLGDGVYLWGSNPMQKGVIEDCRISVEDVDVLELQVQCPGGNGNVRAVWLDPQILK